MSDVAHELDELSERLHALQNQVATLRRGPASDEAITAAEVKAELLKAEVERRTGWG